MAHVRDLQHEAYRIAEENGFHEDGRSRAKVLALIHSEVTEALKADRGDEGQTAYATELADIVIRVLDHAKEEDIALEETIRSKMSKNGTRSHKHGGKKY